VADGADPTVDRVEAAQRGERRALESLLHDHYDRVYAVCHRLVGNDADAADAAQDAMISIVRGLGRFDGRSSFSTWAHRIAYNASIDLLRRRSRRRTKSIDDDLLQRTTPGNDLIAPIEERLDLSVFLHALPMDFRGPVVLRDLCGLDYAEIGEILGLPPGTVRSRIARGRAMLVDSIKAARSEK
jgi:RNA polymerase sigma-70 factor (ECF subfamily)